jgi:hypothetical protein
MDCVHNSDGEIAWKMVTWKVEEMRSRQVVSVGGG